MLFSLLHNFLLFDFCDEFYKDLAFLISSNNLFLTGRVETFCKFLYFLMFGSLLKLKILLLRILSC